MNIYLTFDYEIYFGSHSGTAKRCLLEPTAQLALIAKKNNAHFTFFVDCGYLLKLKKYKEEFPELKTDYELIAAQIASLSAAGHDIQLHIHPHWEDTFYNGTAWVSDITRYRIASFEDSDIERIVASYSGIITELTGRPPSVFRAGGWCIQPFEKIKDSLKKQNIRIDSTVYSEGYTTRQNYYYDFRNCPQKEKWRFEDDPAKENSQGSFLEIPIASVKLSPLFFWKLFLWGRLNPYEHKPLGDGYPITNPGYRRRLLTKYTQHCVSVDGYFSTLAEASIREYRKKNFNELVIIGHPKALTRFSLEKLEELIRNHNRENNFTTFTKQIPL